MNTPRRTPSNPALQPLPECPGTECQAKLTAQMSQWGMYMEDKIQGLETRVEKQIKDLETRVNERLGQVEDRLTSDMEKQALANQLAMNTLENNLSTKLVSMKEEIKKALHQGDLTFQSLTNRVEQAQADARAAAEKATALAGAERHDRALERRKEPGTETAKKKGFWDTYIAGNLASTLVALTVSSIVAGGAFVAKSMWEADKEAARSKAEESRRLQDDQIQRLIKALLDAKGAPVPTAPGSGN